MPFNIVRNGAIVEKEILRASGGLEDADVLSHVVDSTTVIENPASSGRYILEAGTVLSLVGGGSTKVQPAPGGVATADVVGILKTTTEFFIGDGVTAGPKTDEVVPVYHMHAHFDTTKLVNYTGNEANVKAALPHCKFT